MTASLSEDVTKLRASIIRLLASVARLDRGDFVAESALPDWTRAHVLTHLARAADSRTRLLDAARAGRVGRQYESEATRAREINEGAARSSAVIRDDLRHAFDELVHAIDTHPADRWDAPAAWLSGNRAPVRGTVTSMRLEVEYHHVDLAAGYTAAQWPPDFIDEELARVSNSISDRAGAPAITLRPGPALGVTHGHDRITIHVTGHEFDLLAWLTGRPITGALHSTPEGPLPQLPALG
ncbi:MAG TPA: maleylpyruvate isomerase family mycothiol-dependent enzyme [Acidimicrobiales bacterium]|jgi:maleylpyruvate isomerase|nr:maleylpyruvate isomerase family mycothiol-dependent enzyme [Acidimicrobiales bacterium]